MPGAIVATPGAPRAIGPYSQGIKANGFLFTAGQVGFDPESGELVDGGIAEQTLARAPESARHPPGRRRRPLRRREDHGLPGGHGRLRR